MNYTDLEPKTKSKKSELLFLLTKWTETPSASPAHMFQPQSENKLCRTEVLKCGYMRLVGGSCHFCVHLLWPLSLVPPALMHIWACHMHIHIHTHTRGNSWENVPSSSSCLLSTEAMASSRCPVVLLSFFSHLFINLFTRNIQSRGWGGGEFVATALVDSAFLHTAPLSSFSCFFPVISLCMQL